MSYYFFLFININGNMVVFGCVVIDVGKLLTMCSMNVLKENLVDFYFLVFIFKETLVFCKFDLMF